MSLRISDKNNPSPIVGDTKTLRIRGLKNADGAPYDLSGAAKIYSTWKRDLGNDDSAALIQISTDANPLQFDRSYASTGNLDVIYSATDTAKLTKDTTYFIDVKAMWSNGVILSIVYDSVTWKGPVTKTTW